MILALSLAGGVWAGCSSPSRLAVDPATGSFRADATPQRVSVRDSLFRDCSGVRLGTGVFEMLCPDLYRFYVARYDVSSSTETCRKIIRRVSSQAAIEPGPDLGLPDSTYAYRLRELSSPSSALTAGSSGFAVCGPHREGGLGLLLAQDGLGTDSSFATAGIATLAYEGAPRDRILPRRPSEVPLLGRTLQAHSSCELKGAQNLSCYPNGQMNWGRFSTLDRAREAQSLQMQASRASGAEVLGDTTVACTFEGVDTQCRRLVYRAPVSRIATLGASNVLVVFYATARVWGRPSRAVCSFYRDQARPNGLAPLCEETLAVPAADTLMSLTPK